MLKKCAMTAFGVCDRTCSLVRSSSKYIISDISPRSSSLSHSLQFPWVSMYSRSGTWLPSSVKIVMAFQGSAAVISNVAAGISIGCSKNVGVLPSSDAAPSNKFSSMFFYLFQSIGRYSVYK